MRLTPNHLEVIFHYLLSPEPHPRRQARAVQDAQQYFVNEGLLMVVGDGMLQVTDRGKAWIEMLLTTPLPVRLWVDPREQQDAKNNQ